MPRNEKQREARRARKKASRERKRAAHREGGRLFAEAVRKLEHPFSKDPEEVALFKKIIEPTYSAILERIEYVNK